MSATIPAPNPSGYQPAPGEGFTEIAVEVRPSLGFQTVGVSGTYTFPQARAYAEALPAIDDAFGALSEWASEKLDVLLQAKAAHEAPTMAAAPAPVAAQPVAPHPATSAPAIGAPAPAPQQLAGTGDNGWAVGQRPNGRGTIKYLRSAVFSTDQLKADVNQLIAQQGLNPAEFVVFDDRIGKYGLETGQQSYAAAKVKPNEGTPLASILGKKALAYVDFNDAGQVELHMSNDGKQALQAIQLAQTLGATPVQTDATPF